MSYDPDPRRRKRKGHRKGVEPAGLKRWRLARKHSYDPKPRHKRRGSSKRNYDPTRSWRSRAGAARRRSYGYGGAGYARGPLGKVEGIAAKWGAVIGFLAGFFIPAYQSYNDSSYKASGKPFTSFMIDGAKNEGNQLVGGKGSWKDPARYLQYKFLGTGGYSHWCMPFWISLVAFIVSRLNIVPQRINRILRPVSTGALAATTIGALFQYGSDEQSYNGNAKTGQNGNQLPQQTASYYT